MRAGHREPKDERMRRGAARVLVALALALGLLHAGAQPALAQVNVSFGDVPSGKTLTVTFDTVVGTPTSPFAANQGALTGTNFSAVLTDDPDVAASADPTLTPLSVVDLEVTKSESIDPVVAGSGPGNLTYVVTVTNVGSSAATGVALSDVLTLPAGVTIDSITPSAGTSYAPPNANGGTWTVGTLAPSGMATLTVVLTVDSSTAAGTDVISDTATVTALDQNDPLPGNDSATEATSVVGEADLSVSKDDGVTSAVPGHDQVVYTIVVSNAGPSDDPSVAVNDTFPAALTCSWTSAAAGGATGNSSSSGAALADTLSMPAGSSVTYTVTCSIDAGATGTLANTATATASVTDPSPGNDSATDGDTVLTPQADLQVSKTESVDPVMGGSGTGNLTYVVTVFNAGPSDATGVTLSEVLTLPAGVSIDSITPSASTTYAPPNAAPGTWTVGSLPVGVSRTLTVVLTVGGAAVAGTDVIDDTASVSGVNETDPNAANNSAFEATSIITNEPPTITSLSSASQSVQYSDAITSVVITATDPDGDTLSLSTTAALPANLALTPDGCVGSGPSTCTFTLDGQVLVMAGSYPIEFTASDGLLPSNSETHTLTVTEEDAVVSFDPNNPAEVLIPAANSPGGDSGPFVLFVDVSELDVPPGLAGMITAGGVTGELNPGAVPGTCSLDGITPGPPDAGGPHDYDVASWSCDFDMVPIGDYTFDVTVNVGGFYLGADAVSLSIVDPCPIPHDGSDSDGDGIPDACDCPCYNLDDLIFATPTHCVDKGSDSAFHMLGVASGADLTAHARPDRCKYKPPFADSSKSSTTPEQGLACREILRDWFEAFGNACFPPR
jgi:uncharacterized repeat protein (TIGR01451 family)